MGFANEILDAIEIMVKQVVEDNTTKIYKGICKSITTTTCTLTINGKDNTVKYYGGTPIVGTVYQVFIPFGNMSAAFIIVPGAGGQDPETGVSSVNGKTGAVVLTASDVGALSNTTTIPTQTSQLENNSGFITSAEVPTKVSQLNNDTGFITSNDVPEYSVVKATDTVDYAAVYYLTKNGVNTGVAINIPKDLFVESGEIVTNPSGQPAGKYLKLVLQNQTEPIYINVADLVDAYTSGLGITISTNNEISIKIVVGNGLSVEADGIKMATVTTTTNGAMSSSDKAKLDGIEDGAQKNTVTGVKGDNEATYRVGNVNITKANIGLSNVDNVKQYSTSNPPPYPVTSVNNKTGAVVLDASDVGALPDTTVIPVVNDATLDVQRNGVSVGTFTANASTDKTINITVPTKASDVGAVSISDVTTTLGTSTTKVPSEKAVSDAIGAAGGGDMLKSTYDPQNKATDIFAYADDAANARQAKITAEGVLKGDGKGNITGIGTIEGTGFATINGTGINTVNGTVMEGTPMVKSVYDNTGAVANIGGIVAYVKANCGVNIITSAIQPSGQSVGDYWYDEG